MMLFASTSPSYLLLRSLDKLNSEIGGEYPEKLRLFLSKLDTLKEDLISHGYTLVGDEPMKITISSKKFGYTGESLAAHLRKCGALAFKIENLRTFVVIIYIFLTDLRLDIVDFPYAPIKVRADGNVVFAVCLRV